ncbi:hypothetical protein, partial [Mesorhizobium sp.]|uniref:hypothetical protein n=1 Tax=Mesorhizobium sp. TaxID=1871066 RepID=UPI001AD11E89
DIGIRWSPQILRDQRQAYHARIDWSRMRLDTVHTPAPRNRKFPHRQLLHFEESDASIGCKQKVEINCEVLLIRLGQRSPIISLRSGNPLTCQQTGSSICKSRRPTTPKNDCESIE